MCIRKGCKTRLNAESLDTLNEVVLDAYVIICLKLCASRMVISSSPVCLRDL